VEVRLLFVVALLVACGPPDQGTTSVGADAYRSARLFPLTEGNAWSYDVVDRSRDAVQDTALHTVTVEAADAEGARLLMNGTEVRYARRDDGIYDIGNGIYVLRDPLRVGQTWPAKNGRQAEVMALGESVETPAGTFENCAHVREEGGDVAVDNYYCLDVGVVRTRMRMTTQLTQQEVVVEALLRAHLLADDGG